MLVESQLDVPRALRDLSCEGVGLLAARIDFDGIVDFGEGLGAVPVRIKARALPRCLGSRTPGSRCRRPEPRLAAIRAGIVVRSIGRFDLVSGVFWPDNSAISGSGCRIHDEVVFVSMNAAGSGR